MSLANQLFVTLLLQRSISDDYVQVLKRKLDLNGCFILDRSTTSSASSAKIV